MSDAVAGSLGMSSAASDAGSQGTNAGRAAREACALLGQDDGQLTLVNLSKGECVPLFEGHTDLVHALDVDWASMRALSAGSDGGVYLWDLNARTGDNLADELDTCSCVRALAVNWNPKPPEMSALEEFNLSQSQNKFDGSPNSRSSITTDRPDILRGRSSLGPTRKSMSFGSAATRGSMSSGKSSHRGSASRGSVLMRAQTAPMKALMASNRIRNSTVPAAYFAVEHLPKSPVKALTGSDDGQLRLWDLTGEFLEKSFNFRLRLISAMAVDWKKLIVLVGHGDSGLDLIDLEASTTLRSFQGHSCLIGAICVSWPKHAALVGSGDGTLTLWNINRSSQVRTLKGHSGGISVAKTHWSSMRAVTGSVDADVRLWSLKQGTCLQHLCRHSHPIRSLSIDWDGGRVISTAAAGPIFLWNIVDSSKGPEEVKLSQANSHETAHTGIIVLQPLPTVAGELDMPE